MGKTTFQIQANRTEILRALSDIDVMNMTRPKKDQLVISSSKRTKIIEIAKSKSIKKHETVIAQLKTFLSSGETKLNKYSGSKHHTAEQTTVKAFKTLKTAGDIQKYIKGIHKLLNQKTDETIKPLVVFGTSYKDIGDNQGKKVRKTGVLMQASNFEVQITADPKKYGIVLNKIVNRAESEEEFFMVMAFLCNDASEYAFHTAPHNESYIKAIKIIEMTPIYFDDEMDAEYKSSKSAKSKHFNKSRKNTHEDIKYIYNRYREDDVNMGAITMSDIFKTDNGHIKNACMINCIREKLVSRGKWNLLREHILTDIGRMELIDDEDTPLSIDDIMPFFVKRKINLVCLDALNNLIVKTEFGNNTPCVHLLISNNHCVLLNKNIKSLGQVINKEDYDCTEGKCLSSNYSTSTHEIEAKTFIFIDTIEDIVAIIKNNVGIENKTLNLIHKEDDMQSVLYSMVQCGFYPKIRRSNRVIMSLTFMISNLNIVIHSQQLSSMERERRLVFNTEAEYGQYFNANEKFSRQYLNNFWKSSYNTGDEEIEKLYTIRAKCMSFIESKDEEAYELDMNKNYTYLLGKIEKVPVFNAVDRFRRASSSID